MVLELGPRGGHGAAEVAACGRGGRDVEVWLVRGEGLGFGGCFRGEVGVLGVVLGGCAGNESGLDLMVEESLLGSFGTTAVLHTRA